MEVFTLKRRTDNDSEPLIAAYGKMLVFPTSKAFYLGTLNAKLVILIEKRYFNGKHA